MVKDVSVPPRGHLISAIISCIITLMIYATLGFYSEWFNSSQLNTILGGFIGSWLFLFSLTSLSNVEMLLFGEDFSSKFIPEILFCLIVAVVAAGVVHRVCATTCILFSILGLYFIDRISNAHYNKSALSIEPIHSRKSNKKNKVSHLKNLFFVFLSSLLWIIYCAIVYKQNFSHLKEYFLN